MDALIETLKQPAVQAIAIVVGLAGLACELFAVRTLVVLKPKSAADVPRRIFVMLYAGGAVFTTGLVAFLLAHPSH